MKRIALRLAAALLMAASSLAAGAADPAKVLRVASPDIETLDPQQYNDSPSFDLITAIFEGLHEWDYLASPAKLVPVGARPVVDAATRPAPPSTTNGRWPGCARSTAAPCSSSCISRTTPTSSTS